MAYARKFIRKTPVAAKSFAVSATPFIPSPQQTAIFKFVTDGKGNAFVEAVAGAGKTTTLIQACKLIAGNGQSIAFAAFNKKIADEIKGKLESMGITANVGTFHSYGFAAWRKIAPTVKVDVRAKWNAILESVDETLHSFVKEIVSLAKQRALGKLGSIDDSAQWESIVDHFNLSEELPDSVSLESAIRVAIDALKESNRLGYKLIDFDDMIYLPVLHGAKLWQNDFVMVDEAQDTNPARRLLAQMMLKPKGRILFVGDRAQAIYGFTGADSDAIDIIIREFNCKTLPLTVTYRCPKSVVAKAQEYVSHIQAHESAPKGELINMTQDQFAEFHSKLGKADAILCRKVKPIVSLAYCLIKKGIACHVEGRDIGFGLIAIVTKWKVKSTDAFMNKLEAWQSKQVETFKAKGYDRAIESLNDKVECIRVIAEGTKTIAEIVEKINALFDDTTGKVANNLTLSTVHKSKGREWNNVYVLGFNEYMPSKMAKLEWEKEQELNIIYVAITRAQKTLTLIG